MLGDGDRHLGRLALGQRIVAAHDPLQLGELADHAARQVGLGEPGRAAGLRLVRPRHMFRDLDRQRFHPRHLLGERAELRVKHDVLQRRHPAFERRLAILIPEEFGVGEARAQHPLVPGDDGGALVLRLHIGDEQEARREPAGVIQEREIFLVRAHRRGEHLRRQRHEGVVDAPRQDHGPFDEAGHLLQQRIVAAKREPGGFRRGFGPFADRGAPLVGIEQHVALRQAPLVVGEAGDTEFVGPQEAVPACLVGEGQDPPGAEIERALEPGTVEHREHAMERPDPAEGLVGEPHGFRPGQRRDRLADQRRQLRRRGAARRLHHREPEHALAGVALLALVEAREPRGFEEALDRLLRRSDARALFLLDYLRLLGRQAIDHQREAPRRGEGLRRVVREAGRLQLPGHEPKQILRRAALHARRNLLGEELDQQLGHQRTAMADRRRATARRSPPPLPPPSRGRVKESESPRALRGRVRVEGTAQASC